MIKNLIRLLSFGVVCGVVLSLIPAFLCNLRSPFSQFLTVLGAGVASGVIVTCFCSLVKPSEEAWWKTGVVGVLSLPLGAFVFGFVLAVVHQRLADDFGITYRLAEPPPVGPVTSGSQLAAASLSLLPMVFSPLAVLSTHLLWRLELR